MYCTGYNFLCGRDGSCYTERLFFPMMVCNKFATRYAVLKKGKFNL